MRANRTELGKQIVLALQRDPDISRQLGPEPTPRALYEVIDAVVAPAVAQLLAVATQYRHAGMRWAEAAEGQLADHVVADARHAFFQVDNAYRLLEIDLLDCAARELRAADAADAREPPEPITRCSECEEDLPGPGRFVSGVPGILACMDEAGLLIPTTVERCDACARYRSDAEALQALVYRGLLRVQPLPGEVPVAAEVAGG